MVLVPIMANHDKDFLLTITYFNGVWATVRLHGILGMKIVTVN